MTRSERQTSLTLFHHPSRDYQSLIMPVYDLWRKGCRNFDFFFLLLFVHLFVHECGTWSRVIGATYNRLLFFSRYFMAYSKRHNSKLITFSYYAYKINIYLLRWFLRRLNIESKLYRQFFIHKMKIFCIM